MILEAQQTTIWGEPLPEFQDQPSRTRAESSTQSSSLLEQLRFFLRSQIDEWAPDFIIVHERKGTAILRALIDLPLDPLKWSWKNTIASTVLDQLPLDFFEGKRLLIFDDMIRTGKALAPVLDRLKQMNCLSPDLVRLAIFAAHEDSTHNGVFRSNELSIGWFYRDVAPQGYRRLRAQLLNLLQRSGSLMLDTEHIEVRITLHTGVGRLLSALRRRAEAIVFQSAANRTNITVFYPDDAAHRLPSERFPVGCTQTGIVKKCRIVQRDADEFAIIPICLPSVPAGDYEWPENAADRKLLGAAAARTPNARFYGAALLASLYPLQWILRDLYAADPSAVTISLPTRSPSTGAGYSLEHLGVMYPTLDLDLIVQMIAETDRTAHAEGARLRTRKFEARPYSPVSDAQLRNDAMRLLQAIANSVDHKHAVELLFNPTCYHRPGLRPTEVFDLAQRLKFERPYASALFDILIDDGSIVTRVESVADDDGIRRLVRTFKPDGEAVSELVRHFTVQWGLPRDL